MIVDAQNEYDHGLLAISDVKSSRAVIANVLKKYRDAHGDVVSKLAASIICIYITPSPLSAIQKHMPRDEQLD